MSETELNVVRDRLLIEHDAAIARLGIEEKDLEQRIAEFERRSNFILLCFCAIASCIGITSGVATFLLAGMIYVSP